MSTLNKVVANVVNAKRNNKRHQKAQQQCLKIFTCVHQICSGCESTCIVCKTLYIGRHCIEGEKKCSYDNCMNIVFPDCDECRYHIDDRINWLHAGEFTRPSYSECNVCNVN